MIEHSDLSRPIYLKIKEMILAGELKQGEKIVQEKIAESLGVSRTPLRKALLTLENEYLVESIPRRGMYIKSWDEKEIIDIYICREAIEGMAARLLAMQKNQEVNEKLEACFSSFSLHEKIDLDAYAKADEIFHSLLIKLTDNSPLDKIYFFGEIHSKIISRGLVRAPEETLEEHSKIITAIKQGNADEAEQYAREHVKKSRELLIHKYKNQDK